MDFVLVLYSCLFLFCDVVDVDGFGGARKNRAELCCGDVSFRHGESPKRFVSRQTRGGKMGDRRAAFSFASATRDNNDNRFSKIIVFLIAFSL